MQATTGESWEKRYSPSFRESDPLRRQSSTKRKRDEVLRSVFNALAIATHFIIIFSPPFVSIDHHRNVNQAAESEL
jgi:hypothetical protein